MCFVVGLVFALVAIVWDCCFFVGCRHCGSRSCTTRNPFPNMEAPGTCQAFKADAKLEFEAESYKVWVKGIILGLFLGILFGELLRKLLRVHSQDKKDSKVNVEVNVRVAGEQQDKLKGDVNLQGNRVEYEDITCDALKDMLKKKGLKVTGLKRDLVQRLKDNEA